MGRKPKIIPHILGTVDEIAEAIFAKDRAYIQAKKNSKQTQKQINKTRKEKE